MLTAILRCSRLHLRHRLVRAAQVLRTSVRTTYYYIPPDQYGHGPSRVADVFGSMRRNWEVIPLFATVAVNIGLVAFALTWSIKHKEALVFRTHCRENISRTMNLDCPTVHKVITINQRYEPWRQMAAVLDKMEAAEQRLARRVKVCGCDDDGSDF